MKNRWSWLALGVGAYLAFTLATVPAGTVVRWFAPPVAKLSGIQGTLWSGAAASADVNGLMLQDLRWRLHPGPLLLGRLSASVEARLADGFINTDVVATTSGVRFTNLRGGASLAALADVLPVHGMRGQASAQLSSLELANGWPSRVIGELKLADLEVTPIVPDGKTNLLPLGGYTLTFGEAPPGSLAARFVDSGWDVHELCRLIALRRQRRAARGFGQRGDQRIARVHARCVRQATRGRARPARAGAQDHDRGSRCRRPPPVHAHRLAVGAGQPRNSASNGKYNPR